MPTPLGLRRRVRLNLLLGPNPISVNMHGFTLESSQSFSPFREQVRFDLASTAGFVFHKGVAFAHACPGVCFGSGLVFYPSRVLPLVLGALLNKDLSIRASRQEVLSCVPE